MTPDASPPHATAPTTTDEKLRNRLSQRAFRRRQAQCVRELRSRVNVDQRPDSERVTELQRENARLRAQLVEVQSKLARLLATVQTLTDSVSVTLDVTDAEGASDEGDRAAASVQQVDLHGKQPEFNNRRESPVEAAEDTVINCRPITAQTPIARPDNYPRTMYQQIPNIWSFEYQMGLEPYMDAISASHLSSIMLGKEWIHSNSPFSDHIHVLQCLLKDKFSMMVFTNQYPLVIDWIPFSSIRDRLIQLHAANPLIDQIFCDAVSGYVVESLILDLPIGPVKTMPAPDVASLFSSPEYAAAAFKYLNMDPGASYYKIDPAFFGKYPELYDQSSHLTASGIPLKPDLQISLMYPKPLNTSTVETYRSFIYF
ncbi:hypothetical protein QQZ08_007627 [Neonectria magnoliae]|uniref:BZIP domain-containing protein n=1 Tax=Neonectria magnoliae TaxID=2732573 RepID=A0ABR1HZ55_9HYPO